MVSQEQVVPPPPPESSVTPSQQTSSQITQTAQSAQTPQMPSVSPQSRGRVLSLVLAGALPLLAGTMVWWPWGPGDMFDSELTFWTVVVSGLVLALLGGGFLRSMWAVLVIPCAWLVGEMASSVVVTLIQGGTFNNFWDVTSMFVAWATVPLAVCGGFGALLGKWWHRERQLQRDRELARQAEHERELLHQ